MKAGRKEDASRCGRWTGCDKEAKREGGVGEDENHYAPGLVPGSQALQQTEQTDSPAHSPGIWWEGPGRNEQKQVSR